MRPRPENRNPRLRAVLVAIGSALALSSEGAAVQVARADLADLSLEQLSNVVVTSVSRREERLADAPASIYVITAQEIRASGATSIPEALRLAPNLNVARADAVQYAISARGFNNVLANKMLVMIDGRTVYTPLFSGVFWEAQDVVMADVDRIEVISGPGGTLWGANAVNGVINVITKSSKDTQGALVSAGLGTRETRGAVRYGGELAGGHYRLYAKSFDKSNSELLDSGADVRDSAQFRQAGFRADWEGTVQSLTLQGDAYSGGVDQVGPSRDLSGNNLLARYARRLESGSVRVQAYFDRTDRYHPGNFKESLETFDVEAQHAIRAGAHTIVYGGGYRRSRDDVENFPAQAFIPERVTLSWSNLFVQDTYALRPDMDLILGAKGERNGYTGSELLPTARLAWRPSTDSLLWAAISRAVRAPSRLDRDLFLPANPPYQITPGEMESEIASVAELGWRARPSASFSYSLTLFHADFEHLRSLGLLQGRPVFANDLEGRTTGLEGWGRWQVAPTLAVSGGFVSTHKRIEVRPGGIDLANAGRTTLGNDPDQWVKLRLSWTPTRAHEVDLYLRHYAALEFGNVPAYTAVDARLGWRVTQALELALVLQNLTDEKHTEWSNRVAQQRSAFLNVTWRR